jgi:hypothetical protein
MRVSTKSLLPGLVAVVVGSGLLLAAPSAQASTVSRSSDAATTVSAVAAATPYSAPVTGSFTDASGGQGVFAGTFAPTEFTSTATDVIATGTLTGTLTDAAGTSLGTVTRTVSTPVDRSAGSNSTLAAASCQILDLRLQPLDLDLLGLKVHLDTVHLNITAQTGPGNLLGNLLCAVTGLLDGAGALSQIAALLNQILAILNGLGG